MSIIIVGIKPNVKRKSITQLIRVITMNTIITATRAEKVLRFPRRTCCSSSHNTQGLMASIYMPIKLAQVTPKDAHIMAGMYKL